MMASYVGLLRHSFASLATDIDYNEPTIAALLGHKAHSITSRYVHSSDVVLLVAADAVANATMNLMKQGDLGSTPEFPLPGGQRMSRIGTSHWSQLSFGSDRDLQRPYRWRRIKRNHICEVSIEMGQSSGTESPYYRCFRDT